ncbi:nucleotidyltransferase family protein [Paenibacillus sp. MWE-103]|uniref:Nucleotidyltransferase family protein n=1 Tax=Paenibacillus artemisiicola TaxID=1172618 RepID=A0ABS3WBN4_9BACL|nr:nucleotidyltransferase family protein [Paenibacillus artemisiicola]MBO7745703.1 nucleotidyltransferase family protein [Paenibacillus artemisiicola]
MLTERDIIRLVESDAWRMEALRAARTLELPDWWICAGFVRSLVWDALHGYAERTPLADVDVVYYDAGCLDEGVEKALERKLRDRMPGVPWSVKNEARMHVLNGGPPYASSVDAIGKFPETATALGFALDADDRVRLTAPCGIGDAVRMIVRPTPHFRSRPELAAIYERRLASKDWSRLWPKIRVRPIRD